MPIYIGNDGNNKKIKKIYVGSSSGTGSVRPCNVTKVFIGTSNGNKQLFPDPHVHSYEYFHYDDDTICTAECRCGDTFTIEHDWLYTDNCGPVDDSYHSVECSRCGYSSLKEHDFDISYEDFNYSNHFKRCYICDHQVSEKHTWVYDGNDPSDGDRYRCTICGQIGYARDGAGM